jgi:hypothetical protein
MWFKKQIKKEVESVFEKQKQELDSITQSLQQVNERTRQVISGAENFKDSIISSMAQLDDAKFGTNFLPLENLFAIRPMQIAYQAATAEAIRLYNIRGIQTWITALQPYHFGYSDPILKDVQRFIVKQNCALFPYGIINNDSETIMLEWYIGDQIDFINDWFVKEIYNYANKTGLYMGNLEAYNFRGEQEFTLKCTSIPKKPIHATWLKAYVVLPHDIGKNQIFEERIPLNKEEKK